MAAFATGAAFTSDFVQYQTELQELITGPLSGNDPVKFNSQSGDVLKAMKMEARQCGEGKAGALEVHKTMKAEVDRIVLMGGAGSLDQKTVNQRERIMQTNDKISSQNDTIKQIVNQVAEIEDTGAEITGQLAGNREQIEKQKGRVGEIKGMTEIANKMANRMSKWWA